MKVSRFLSLTVLVAGIALAQGAGSYLGVWVWQVDAARAQELKLSEVVGVEITRVQPESPAEAAGLKAGDVLTHYNGQRIENNDQFAALVRDTKPGQKVVIQFFREGNSRTAAAKIGSLAGARPEPAVPPRPMVMVPDVPRSVTTWRSPVLGIDDEALDGQMAAFFGVAAGVLVRGVHGGSPAEKAGLKAGDVIVAVNGHKVATPGDINMRLRALDGCCAALMVMRDRKEITVNVGVSAEGAR